MMETPAGGKHHLPKTQKNKSTRAAQSKRPKRFLNVELFPQVPSAASPFTAQMTRTSTLK
jgi:hypothetical protein